MTITAASIDIFLMCPRCQHPIESKSENSVCEKCQLKYKSEPNYLSYDADTLLRENFKRQWFLSKALQNNGLISYIYASEGSLSLDHRDDVKKYGQFIAKYFSSGTILDIGCGILPLPGYFQFLSLNQCCIIGLDPLDNRDFKGFFIKGCAEYLPLLDNSVDAVLFGTSLDHVVDIDRTLQEARRVLKENGKVLVWMGDPTEYVKGLKQQKSSWFLLKQGQWQQAARVLWEKIYNKYALLTNQVDESRYWPCGEEILMYIPSGAVDPYHSYHETPAFNLKKFSDNGYRLLEHIEHSKNIIFMAFEKG